MKYNTKIQHQKNLRGCGIACMANLLQLNYDFVKKDFKNKFYSIVAVRKKLPDEPWHVLFPKTKQ